MIISYEYASGDLLENRNTYFYTKYQGSGFLASWRQQREDIRVMLDDSTDAGNHADSSTHGLLDTILRGLSSHDSTTEALQLLDRLVQRFEVTKRLHAIYNENWRPVDVKDYRDMELYVRFSEVLDLAYTSTSMLPYLNALLKCMDTLTALPQRLDAAQQSRLKKLIICERSHVDRLAQKIPGVKNAT